MSATEQSTQRKRANAHAWRSTRACTSHTHLCLSAALLRWDRCAVPQLRMPRWDALRWHQHLYGDMQGKMHCPILPACLPAEGRPQRPRGAGLQQIFLGGCCLEVVGRASQPRGTAIHTFGNCRHAPLRVCRSCATRAAPAARHVPVRQTSRCVTAASARWGWHSCSARSVARALSQQHPSAQAMLLDCWHMWRKGSSVQKAQDRRANGQEAQDMRLTLLSTVGSQALAATGTLCTNTTVCPAATHRCLNGVCMVRQEKGGTCLQGHVRLKRTLA